MGPYRRLVVILIRTSKYDDAHRDQLEALAQALLNAQSLNAKEIRDAIGLGDDCDRAVAAADP